MFETILQTTGTPPSVIDGRDVLLNPEAMLRRLCGALDVPFTAAMLSWEPGPRSTDGVWAKHWYDSVLASTRFQPYKPKSEPLPRRLDPLRASCRPYYERLYNHRLTP